MSENRAQSGKPAREATSAAADAGASAVHATANATANAAQRGAEAIQNNGHVASEALRESGQAAAEAARRAGEAGAETFRRSADAVAQSQRQIAQDAAERFQGFTRAVTETAQGTAEDFRTLLRLPQVADRGLHDFHQGVTNLVEGVVQTNMRATQDLFRLTNFAPFVEAQQRYVRDYISVVLESSAAIVRAVRQTAEQTLPPLEQHLRDRQQALGRQGNNRHQNAAE